MNILQNSKLLINLKHLMWLVPNTKWGLKWYFYNTMKRFHCNYILVHYHWSLIGVWGYMLIHGKLSEKRTILDLSCHSRKNVGFGFPIIHHSTNSTFTHYKLSEAFRDVLLRKNANFWIVSKLPTPSPSPGYSFILTTFWLSLAILTDWLTD